MAAAMLHTILEKFHAYILITWILPEDLNFVFYCIGQVRVVNDGLANGGLAGKALMNLIVQLWPSFIFQFVIVCGLKALACVHLLLLLRHTIFYCSWSEKILLYVKRVVEPEGGHILVALWLSNNILHCNFLPQGMQQYTGSHLSPKICQMGSSMKMGAPNVLSILCERICQGKRKVREICLDSWSKSLTNPGSKQQKICDPKAIETSLHGSLSEL